MSLLISGGSSPPPHDLYLNKGQRSSLLARFKGFIRKERLFPEKSSILVAVSGGPDSICLLNLLFLLSPHWSLRLAVAHFDHGLRGEESKRDRDFVQQVCQVNTIPFFSECADVKAKAQKLKKGVQDTARQLRYSFFRKTAKSQGMEFIATGHTCDDQAEEILFRLVRGSGPEGLSGIRLKRADNVIRPLLFCRKTKIIEYLERYQIPFVTDSSNLEIKYTRNKIRRLIMPVIETEINPSVADAIYRAGRLLAEDSHALETMADMAYEDCLMKDIHLPGPALDRRLLLGYPRALRKRIYKRAMERAGIMPQQIRYDHLEKTEEIALSDRPSAFYCLPEKYLLLRSYDALCFIKGFFSCKGQQEPSWSGFSIVIKGPGHFKLPEGLGELLLQEVSCSAVQKDMPLKFPRPLYINLDKVDFPFLVTLRKKGDRFQPFGQEHSGKLKKFLIGRHIPRFVRDFLPILRKGDNIIAVCGIEISQEAEISPKSSRCLKILWEPEEWLTILTGLKNPN